ncbi:MAG: reverse gyrase [Thermofilum sp.]|uniref:Reverse gyrase n=1 Tax=Thermofilum pendens TaxID=2269 RepID=A0A7C4D3D2_THEPE
MELETARAVFREMCYNCGGAITDYRLSLKLPCGKCLEEIPEELSRGAQADLYFIASELEKRGKAGGVKELVKVRESLERFSSFFEEVVGSKPWSAQRTWALRALRGNSFAILAPTGVGKTMFGMVLSLYLARQGKRCYMIFPNTALLTHVHKRISELARRAGVGEEVIVAYHAGLSKSEKENILQKVATRNFSILLSTPHFLQRNFELLSGIAFDLIFVDDVDSVLKSSKGIDKLLLLLGFAREDVEKAMELIYTRLKLAAALRRGSPPGELAERVRALEEEVRKAAKSKHGILLVSTATGRARGLRVRLFRELLGFEVGSRSEQLRNVVDTYVLAQGEGLVEEVARLSSRLGRGGLIFVPLGTDESTLNSLLDAVRARGLKVELVRGRLKKQVLGDFEEGRLDVLVGTASYYGLLVRGLDMPHVVKYVIFAGIPHFKLKTDVTLLTPVRLLQLASNVAQIAEKEDRSEMERLISAVRRALLALEPHQYRALMEALKRGEELPKLAGILRIIKRLQELVRKYLESKEHLYKLVAETSAMLTQENGVLYLIIPDILTYIQASGRSSRLYTGGISKGLSVLVADNEELLKKFIKASRTFLGDGEWVQLAELNLDALIREITEERERIRRIIRGESKPEEVSELLRTALVVVESPTKARTIASFFGRPSRRRIGRYVVYEVTTGNYQLQIAASMGHIFDLITSMFNFDGVEDVFGVLTERERGLFVPVFTTIKRCLSCGRQFTDYREESGAGRCPYCGSTTILDKAEIVSFLRSLAAEVDEVLIATDPDTEGEKIAWDIAVTLSPYARSIKRIEFHEVTRKAFEEALKNPREINTRMVEAQLVRRIEDRWIGFALSKALWKEFGMDWLSAGRVQTPVLGWVISRYREVSKSIRPVFTLELEPTFRLLVDNMKLDGKKPSEVKDELLGSEVRVTSIATQEREIHPPPPFTTDTMLREANRLYGFSADEVMRLAQDLFEMGLITYHRTDSTHVSEAGIAVARAYLMEKLGEEYFWPRRWGEAGAHECIRPTRPYDAETLLGLIRQGLLQLPVQLSREHLQLYSLIFRRFMASQMAPSRVKEEKLRVEGLYFEKEVHRVAEILFDGFARLLPLGKPVPLQPGVYKVVRVEYRRRPTLPLYTQADLVGLMKERKLGRPSTYAEIVKKLLARNYVLPVKRGKLVPTKLGVKVYEYLAGNYGQLVSEEKTAEVLEKMDLVEQGLANYKEVLAMFYDELVAVIRRL